jgi:hypothetical protein
MVHIRSSGKRFKAVIVGAVVAGGMALLPATPATAHVHGITPLRCVAPDNAGANRADDTPASASQGGPIPDMGLIPPLEIGDGGFDTPACPA